MRYVSSNILVALACYALVGCQAQVDLAVDSLTSQSESTQAAQTLSIESSSDGSGVAYTSINVEDTQSQIDIFPILRNENNTSFEENPGVTWAIADSSIATITSTNNGKQLSISSFSVGSTTIIATTGTYTKTISLTVTQSPRSLSVESLADGSGSTYSSISVTNIANDIDLFSILRFQSDSSFDENTAVTWSISNSIATLTTSSDGKKLTIGSFSVGSATIEATANGRTTSVNLTVTAAPAPVPTDDRMFGNIDDILTIPVLSNDSNQGSGPLTLTAVSSPSNGSANISGSNIVYTPNASFEGKDTFTYTVRNDLGVTETGTVNVYFVTTYTWVGLGSDSNWSTNENWCGVISEGECQGTSAPNSSQVAVFTSGCIGCDVTVDTTVNVSGINMQSSYAGTITQGSVTITTGNDAWIISGGTFQGSSDNIFINRRLTINGGTFNSTSGTLRIFGNHLGARTILDGSSPSSFIHNNGTVFLYSSKGCGGGCSVGSHGDSVSISGEITFYDLDIQLIDQFSGGGWNEAYLGIDSGSTLTVENDFTFVDGYLGGTGTINVENNLIVECLDGASGSSCAGGGSPTLVINGSGPQTYAGEAGGLAPRVIINNGSTFSESGGTNLGVSELTIKSGSTFNAPSGTLEVGYSLGSTTWSNTDGFTIESGAIFNHNNGTVTFNGKVATYLNTVSVTLIDVSSSVNFYNMIVNVDNESAATYTGITIQATDRINILNNFTLTNGRVVGGTLNVEGNLLFECADLANQDCAKNSTSSILITGSNSQTISSDADAENFSGTIVVNKDSGGVTQLSNINFTQTGQDFYLVQGTWDMDGYDLDIDDTLSLDSGTSITLSGGNLSNGLGTISSGAYDNGTINP